MLFFWNDEVPRACLREEESQESHEPKSCPKCGKFVQIRAEGRT